MELNETFTIIIRPIYRMCEFDKYVNSLIT